MKRILISVAIASLTSALTVAPASANNCAPNSNACYGGDCDFDVTEPQIDPESGTIVLGSVDFDCTY